MWSRIEEEEQEQEGNKSRRGRIRRNKGTRRGLEWVEEEQDGGVAAVRSYKDR